jgi:hypothetical protein
MTFCDQREVKRKTKKSLQNPEPPRSVIFTLIERADSLPIIHQLQFFCSNPNDILYEVQIFHSSSLVLHAL